MNATVDSTFDECFNSPYWVETPALVNPPDPNSNLLRVLNRPKVCTRPPALRRPSSTRASRHLQCWRLPIHAPPCLLSPQGVFCACSATIINKLLDNFRYAKYMALVTCVFLFLVFVSCCYLCCCAKPVSDEAQNVQLTPVGPPQRGWSAGGTPMGAPIQTNKKARGKSNNDGAYLARP